MRKEGRMEFFEGNFSMFHGNQSLKYGFNWSSYRSNFKDKYYFKIYSLYSSNIFERNRNVITWMWMEMNGNFSRKIKSAISLWRLSTSLSFSFHSFSLISLLFFFLFFSKNNPLLHQPLPVPFLIIFIPTLVFLSFMRIYRVQIFDRNYNDRNGRFYRSYANLEFRLLFP